MGSWKKSGHLNQPLGLLDPWR